MSAKPLHLFLVGRLSEDLLNVAAHVQSVQHFVALVQDKVLDALEVEGLGADEAEDAARGADHDVRAVLLQGLLVLVDGHTAEEDGDLQVLHVLGETLVLLRDLEGQLTGVAHGDDGRGADRAENYARSALPALDLPIGDFELLESGQDENGRLTHTGLGLADNIHTSDGLGDALVLNLNFY